MALREYSDETGVRWRVWQVQPGSFAAASVVGRLPDEFCGGWLCFESEGEKRRLMPVPPSWDERSDSELDVLRRAAESVQTSAVGG